MIIGTTPPSNVQALLAALAHLPEADWLEQGRALALHADLRNAAAVFEAAAAHFPESSDARLGWAGLLWQTGQAERAEHVLHEWLVDHPADAGAAFLLCELLREQGRLKALGDVLLAVFKQGTHDVNTVIRAVETLDDYGRPSVALAICESAIARGLDDPRLHAYAGMLGIQQGQFGRTRAHYERALLQTPDAIEWNIPLGLSSLQRYESTSHPDFRFFQNLLARRALSDQTRRGVLFALGKAYDDIGDTATATTYLREANAMARATCHWSRKSWKRSIEARLAAFPYAYALPPPDWTPVFIVGVPRSGTTLLADRLAQHPDVRNRGELGWLSFWEQRLASSPPSNQQLAEAAAQCERQFLQDDERARWYIDKQPLNLLRVNFAMALWPNARFIHCQRHPRDVALSLWQQSFHDPAHDYAYDLGNIATVIRDCGRLASHWRKRYPSSFLTVSYEQFVAAPEQTLENVAGWLGLPAMSGASERSDESIATASAWQARQAVYTRSVDRWRRYVDHLPELLTIPEH